MANQYTLKCNATLVGCVMIVEADSPDEALAKAKAGDWDDIEVDGGSISDWEITGKPQLDD